MKMYQILLISFVAMVLEIWGFVFIIQKIILASDIGFAKAISTGDITKAIMLVMFVPVMVVFILFYHYNE
jgi:hypothetical protein